MVGFYDITGFHTTGRQRLSQGLMAGHLRSQRTSVFPSKTVINNNIFTGGYADYGCYDSHSCDSTPKWMNWLMGGGMIASVLGGIFGANKTEGAGGGSDKPAADTPASDNSNLKEDIKALQTQFPDAKLSALSNNTILCNGTKCKDIDEALKILNKTPDKTSNPVNLENNPNKAKKTENSENSEKSAANNDGKTEVTAPEVNTDPVINAANVHKTTGVVKKAKNTGSSPAGWYRATKDLKDNVKGITIENLKNAQKNGKSAATYVLEQVLATKGGLSGSLSNNNKAQLLGEIIRKNPSVFNPDGSLKEGADVNKLDVPTAKWVENTYGVNRTQSGQGYKKQEKADNYYVVRGNNGYHAKYDKTKKIWTYHNPQGQEIPEKEFQKVCKNIHASIKRREQVNKWNSEHPNQKVTINKDGTLSTIVKKDTGTSYGVVSKKITANSFEELQKEVEKYLNKGKNGRGGYTAVGGAANKTNKH